MLRVPHRNPSGSTDTIRQVRPHLCPASSARTGPVLLLLLLLPCELLAGQGTWCVDPDGGSTPSCCAGAINAAPFSDLSTAFDAAAADADAPFERASFCVGSTSAAPLDIVIDTSTGVFASEISVQFDGGSSPNWCPDALGVRHTDPSDEGVRLSISGLHFDQSLCPTPTVPLVVSQGGDLELTDARILDLAGSFLEFESNADSSVQIDVRTSRIEGGSGPAFTGSGELRIDRTEVSARTASVPLIDVQEETGFLNLAASIFFGNAVTGSEPLIRSRAIARVNSSTFSANAIESGAALFVVDSPNGIDPVALGWIESNIVDNRVHASNALAAPPVPRPIGVGDPQAVLCLPRGSDGLRPRERERPQAPTSLGAGDLIRVLGLPGPWGLVVVQKSYFVGNHLSEAGSLVALGGNEPRHVVFVHNTVDEPRAATIRALTDVNESWLVSARNLLLGAPRLELGSNWGSLETTMELIEGDAVDWLAGATSASGLSGPFPPGVQNGSTDFLLGPAAEQLSDCELALAHCQDSVPANCSDGTLLDGFAHCGLDGAAAYLPSSEGLAQLGYRWPWVNSGLPQLAKGSGENFPGAAGWVCGSGIPEPFDFSDDEGPYDGDGATGLTDCDNYDASVVPEVPEVDGFTAEGCEDTACYECPGERGADDNPEGDAVGPATVGCGRTGCGTPLVFVGLLPLALPRMRRRR